MFKTPAIALLALMISQLAFPAFSQAAMDAQTALKTEALVRWGQANCPDVKIHPMIMMVANLVAKKASRVQLDALQVQFDAAMKKNFATTAQACVNASKVLSGPSKSN